MEISPLSELRGKLADAGLDAFIIPQSDEHLSEFIAPDAQRLRWLTGFTGSAGIAAVTARRAAVVVDGRYTDQVGREVDRALWSCEPDLAGWLLAQLSPGARVGYDPWLHSADAIAALKSRFAERRIAFVPVAANPVDALWQDRPQASRSPILVWPEDRAGRSSADKRAAAAQLVADAGADAMLISALDALAWLFNIRGRDIPHVPVALMFALLGSDGGADIFVDPGKVTPELVAHLGPSVRLHRRDDLEAHILGLGGRRIAVDRALTVDALVTLLDRAGAAVVALRDPITSWKAQKTPEEIAGHRAAQLLDGVALTRFLHWMALHAPFGEVDEIGAADRLGRFRAEAADFLDLSFTAISATGPNAACPHYMPTAATNRRIGPDDIYLIDSGGQYVGGTTDVTRTMAIGAVDAEHRDRFTRVLKGHIALAMARFPVGTRGGQLDGFARRHLWEAGLDYNHGTGHGVGASLSVHEGPARIAKPWPTAGGVDEPLCPGMILSNEPGYYKPDRYGIRIENLLLVVSLGDVGGDQPCLGFETLTFAPIDRRLIDVALLTPDERAWVDAYHAEVLARIGPALSDDVRDWLTEVSRPLAA
nr:aminopeptidase P family protein [Sphingomonas sp. Y57]